MDARAFAPGCQSRDRGRGAVPLLEPFHSSERRYSAPLLTVGDRLRHLTAPGLRLAPDRVFDRVDVLARGLVQLVVRAGTGCRAVDRRVHDVGAAAHGRRNKPEGPFLTELLGRGDL